MPATDEEYKPYLDSPTKAIRLVSEYTLLSFNDVVELDCYTFKVLVRDAFVDKMSQTKEGQEYLEKCWLLTQTTPNKEALRKRFGKGGN